MSDAIGSTTVGDWIERISSAMEAGQTVEVGPVGADRNDPRPELPAAAVRAVLARKDPKADPRGLRIQGARITGAVDLENLSISFPLHLTHCLFDSDIDLSGCVVTELNLEGCHTQAVLLYFATVSGSLHAPGLQAAGEVNAHGAHIGGQVNLSGARLRNAQGNALDLENATIGGGVFAHSNFVATGMVRAIGTTIGGQLNLGSATIYRCGKQALVLDNANVGGDILASNKFTVSGCIHAVGVHVAGQLDLTGATVTNPGQESVVLDNADIAASLHATNLRASGTVRALGAKIRGELHLDGAQITSPRRRTAHGSEIEPAALNLDTAAINRGTFMRDGFRAEGRVRLHHATIGGQLVVATPSAKDAITQVFSAENATIEQLVIGPPSFDGTLNLMRATVGDIVTPGDGLPSKQLMATGWQVEDVHGAVRTDRGTVSKWLQTDPSEVKATQPWHALAAVYDRNGDPAGAKWLRFAAANQATRQSRWYTKIGRAAYLLLVGYGYYPLVAGIWLIAVVALGCLLVGVNHDDIVSTKPVAAQAVATADAPTAHNTAPPEPITAKARCQDHPTYPCFNTFTYMLATLVPFAATASSDWAIRSDGTSWLTIGIPVLKISAWALAALLGAGVTGVLRKG